MRTEYFVDKYQSGMSFWIRSQKAGMGNYKDPYLRNGAGNRPGFNFQDELTSYRFLSC